MEAGVVVESRAEPLKVLTEGLCVPTPGVMPDDETASASNCGWQKVINPKRQRRLEALQLCKTLTPTAESQVFQALEVQAADRRAQLNHEGIPASAALDLNSNYSNKPVAPTDELPKGKKPKRTKVSPGELGAAIDPVDLSLFLDGVMESYMAMPEVQLMRFADYFGRIFHPISAPRFAWDNIIHETPLQNAIEIPICYLPESVCRVAYDWLSRMPAEELWKFTLWLLRTVGYCQPANAMGITSQKSKVGVLVVLALVLRNGPDIFLQHASAIQTDAELPGLHALPALAWIYGQVAKGDLVVGMSLWVRYMLPVAVGKSSTPMSRHIALQFIESILLANLKKARAVLLNGLSKQGERLVPPAALDSLMRLAYPPDCSRTKATERFYAIYPLVKELCLAGSFGTKSTRPVAQQLLPLSLDAAGSDVKALSYEACQNFIWCLQQNPECYLEWEKLHLSNLKGSLCVLQHLCTTWKENVARLTPLDDLKRTVLSFRSMHRNAIGCAADKELEVLWKEAERLYKLVCRKSSALPACGKATATLVLGLVLAYGFYLLSPPVNPWNWDGQILLSKTHSLF